VNIGLEGMLLAGAFFGVLGADKLGGWVWGVSWRPSPAALLALIHAVVSIHLRARPDPEPAPPICFLGVGLTGYLFVDIYGPEGTPGDIPRRSRNIHLAFLDGVPFFGDAFGNLNLMIWVAILLLPVAVLRGLPDAAFGLRLRSVGEHPRAARAWACRCTNPVHHAVVLSGVLAGLGVAFLVDPSFVNSFSERMTAGAGFIALAALIFGTLAAARPLPRALLFGFSRASRTGCRVYSDSLGGPSSRRSVRADADPRSPASCAGRGPPARRHPVRPQLALTSPGRCCRPRGRPAGGT